MASEGDARVSFGTKFAKMSGEKSEITSQQKNVIKLYILNYPWTKGTN